MNKLKRLAGDAVIYGFSTILGRLLNWLLMPVLYVRTNEIAENGAISEILAFTATLLVLFTYGLETGFFRFSKDGKEKDVFKTSLLMLCTSSSFLIVLTLFFAPSINNFLGNGNYIFSIYLIGFTIALDAFLSVPFAKLRLNNKALKFAIIKLSNILINILLNILFLVIIPNLITKNCLPESIENLYQKFDNVFYIFLSMFIASAAQFLFFISDLRKISGSFDKNIAINMLKYCWPVLLVGLTGMLIQNSDKILMSKLTDNGLTDTGLYGVNFKIGVLMSLYTQSFRFAFEPFFFKNGEKGIKSYAKVMEYFVFIAMIIFLGITLYINVINSIITNNYAEGNIIIPYVLMGFLFFGVYYNLSLWYKLTDKTIWAFYFGIIGSVTTISLIFILIPKMGIIGGAIAFASGYFIMMILSYIKGQKIYPIPYNLKKIGIFVITGLLIFFVDSLISIECVALSYFVKTCMIGGYILNFVVMEREVAKNFFRKN